MKLDAFGGARAIVTGGGSGLGRAFCNELGALGAKIVVVDVSLEGAEETASLIRDRGGEALVLHGDVASLGRIEEIVREAERWFGDVDLMINNAGVAVGGKFEAISIEDWRWIVDINLWGVIYGCHVVVPKMIERGRGYVINVASAAGLMSFPEMSPYNVTKAGVVALTETIHAELDGTGVHTTVLCPTFFRTNIAESGRGTDDPKVKDLVHKMMDRSRVQAPDVARAALAAVAKNRLYAVPMMDGQVMWRVKRTAPSAFTALVTRVNRMRSK